MADNSATRLMMALLIAVSALGCQDSSNGSAPRLQIDTLPNGVIQVGNRLPSAGTLPKALRLEEDLRLEGGDGEGAEGLSRIGAMATDSGGQVYVLDVLTQEIWVFNSRGSFSHRFGGRGLGPGEFRGAVGLAVGPGDTVWVIDPQAARYSAFRPDGTFLTTRPRRVSAHVDGSPGRFLDDGRFVDFGLGFPEEGLISLVGSRILYKPVGHSAGFEVQDSFPPLEFSPELMMLGHERVPQPFFSGQLSVALGRNGDVWFSHTREYRILRRTLRGDTSLVFTLEAIPAIVGESERDHVRARLSRRPDILPEYLMALPETKPIIHRIVPDDAGRLFVFAEVAGTCLGCFVDLFDEDGELLARLALPEEALPFGLTSEVIAHATPEHLFLVINDEFGVPSVVRLKLVEEH